MSENKKMIVELTNKKEQDEKLKEQQTIKIEPQLCRTRIFLSRPKKYDTRFSQPDNTIANK